MTVQIPVRIPDEDAERLDAIVASGRYASRSDAIRTGLERILREERDREIEEAYRRGYSSDPQEEWVGQAGLWAFAEFARSEDDGTEPL
jgi:Arc/MetJ-type ribon-helix-helix transcriptional regulator